MLPCTFKLPENTKIFTQPRAEYCFSFFVCVKDCFTAYKFNVRYFASGLHNLVKRSFGVRLCSVFALHYLYLCDNFGIALYLLLLLSYFSFHDNNQCYGELKVDCFHWDLTGCVRCTRNFRWKLWLQRNINVTLRAVIFQPCPRSQ